MLIADDLEEMQKLKMAKLLLDHPRLHSRTRSVARPDVERRGANFNANETNEPNCLTTGGPTGANCSARCCSLAWPRHLVTRWSRKQSGIDGRIL